MHFFQNMRKLALPALLALAVLLAAGCSAQQPVQETVAVTATTPPNAQAPAEAYPEPVTGGAQTAPQDPVAYPSPESPAAETVPPADTAAPQQQPYPEAAEDAVTPVAGEPVKPAPGEALPAEAALRLSRSGGIAGMHEVWTVYADGRVEVSRKPDEPAQPAGQLTPEQVQALLGQLQQLGFFEYQSEGGPVPCCDRITTTVQARGTDGEHSVRLYDGQEGTPAELQQAFEAVSALLQTLQ